MKNTFGKVLGIAFVCALVSAFGLTACSMNTGSASSSSAVEGLTGGVAATVNGKEIMEDDITTYIQDWRNANGYADEESWANYLISIGETAETMRGYMIDGHISEILTEQAASEMGVEVTDAQIDEEVAITRANYETDEKWNEALASAGYTEESYRDNIRKNLLDQGVQEEVSKNAEPISDEDKLKTAQEYATYIDGSRRSSHILFNLEDKEKAEEVLAKLQSGELDFAEAAKEYSIDTGSAAEGGDVGWDKINSFVTEYAEALGKLEVGQMSDLVESQYGYHIIKCTDLFTIPEGGITSFDQLPDALKDIVNSQLESTAKTKAVSDWYTKYKEDADIVINDMPEGLPYDVDLSKYETASSEEAVGAEPSADTAASDDATASADAAASTDAESSTAASSTEQPAEVSSEAEGRSSSAA